MRSFTAINGLNLLKRGGLFLLLLFSTTSALAETRFAPVDLYIDTGTETLAAWQVKLSYDPVRIKIVGIEGVNPAYNQGQPPHYDTRGLRSGTIILAAFGLDKNALPKGRCPVARLHLEVTGEIDFTPTLMAAANPAGKKIKGTVHITTTEKNKEPGS